ncbi:MAG: insulinase family protein [Candidatus Nanopelagicales bacterium]|nr:insulinase family protein [Candidatus Nanopelagicales bacterium]
MLPGGLRVITEQLPGVRSAAFGIWVGVGSRDESHAQMGSAHYLEHLLFKGTRRREALEISSLIDEVGGEMNAFTSKEHTCFYARVLDRDLPLAIDVISDIVTAALLRPEDVDAERGVILEEIAMRDDDPSDLVHDEFMEGMFGPTDLGRSILGTQQTIEGIPAQAIASFYAERYRPEAMVVAAAGALEHDEVVRLVDAAFRASGWLADPGVRPRPARNGGLAPPTSGGLRLVPRPTEQAHLVLGVPGVPRADARRYTLNILSTALGGGMSSRLFQEIRERRGLAYSVYAFSSGFSDAGVFGAYAGCLPSKVDQVLELAVGALDDVARHGLTAEELARGKGQAKGSIVLGLEDSGSRMSRIGNADLVLGELPSIDEVIARIDAITMDDIVREAAALLSAPRALTVIGPFEAGRTFALP